MKKSILLIVFTIFVGCILLSSCDKSNSEEPSTEPNEAVFYTELAQSISNYDSNFAVKLPEVTRKGGKGFWSFFRNIGNALCQVVVADVEGGAKGASAGHNFDKGGKITGAVVGAVIGGAASSGVKIFDLIFGSKGNKADSLLNNKIPRPFSYKITGSNVGQLHNEILIELLEKYETENINLDEVTSERICKDIVALTQNHFRSNSIELDQKSMDELIRSSVEISNELSGLTKEQAIEHLRNCKYGKKEEMNLIADYFVKVLSIEDLNLREQYATGYKEIVKESKIPEESKTMILGTTSTAVNSLNLWESR